MSNLIPMDEAARILGMTVEQVTELRSNNEIFGYKDGANWKFKMSELERVAGELDIKLNTSEAAKVADDLSESFGFDLSDEFNLDDDAADAVEDLDSAEYMEDSSVELANPLDKGLSISKEGDAIDLDADELKLADSGLLGKASDTSKSLADDGPLKLQDDSSDNVLDDDEEELSFGSSSLSLASESSRKLAGSGSSKKLDGDDDFSLPEDDFTFSDDSGSFEDSAELSSDFDDSGSLILDDSDSSAEITLEANESGINLSASSSGISLDESGPLDLGMSDIGDLELPADDGDMIVLDDSASPDASTMMLAEDDFNLTPVEASMDDDDSSGSQVIALEDSEIYADDSAATIIGDSVNFSEPGMLDDNSGFAPDGGSMGYADPGMQMAPEGNYGPAPLPEAPYSIGQIASLAATAVLLLAGGMVAYNLAQNLWMPDDQIIGSGVLNFFLGIVGMDSV